MVQDLFLTETAVYADVILPASAWPEKDGTVTNTNRQVQMGRQALPLPGEAKVDWWITQEIAKRIGLAWNYQHPSEIYAEMASLMPALDNISWDRVAKESSVTYPSDAPDKPGRDVVFDKGFPRPGGFAKLVAAKLTPPDEMPDAEYPFILTTGRQLEHWHTGAMTRRASTLDALEPGPVATLSGSQLAKLGAKAGDMVQVTTRRGTITLTARQDDGVPGRRGVHPVRLCGSGGESADQSEARSVRKNSRVQVLRRQGRGDRSGGTAGGGVIFSTRTQSSSFVARPADFFLPSPTRVALTHARVRLCGRGRANNVSEAGEG